MASAIIHMCVAKKVNEVLKMDENMIFLGSIAPDISKIVGESKVASHFLDGVDEDCIPNCEKFVNKYKDSLNKPFEVGYLIHLLTDKYWFGDYVYRYIRRYMNTSLVRYTQVKDIIYRDYTRLNMKLIDEYELNLYFMCNNIILPSSKIEEIPIDKLQLVIDKMSIIIKELDDSKTVMFDMDDINEFVLECSKMVIRDLKYYGIEVR